MSGDSQVKLRGIDPTPAVHGGRPVLVLRDPLRLSDKTVMVPRQLGPLLALCDGTRDAEGLRASLAVRHGMALRAEAVQQFVRALDEALLLDNERSIEAQTALLEAYRQAPFREPALAGVSYPAEGDGLRELFDGLVAEARGDGHPAHGVRGLACPHIDYARGGLTYARVFCAAGDAIRDAELVVVLGTDHYGSQGSLSLTRQTYATPFGVLPTSVEWVDALAGALGGTRAYDEELHHRTEHSIELAAAWIHHTRGGKPCELVPILCGSYAHLVRGDARVEDDSHAQAFLRELRQVLARGNALVVASADLSHVGPAFGQHPLGLVERAGLNAHDDTIVDRMCAGDAPGFLAALREVGDRYNVCGLPPIHLALSLLAPTEGTKIAYERCPADGQGASLVSVCGVVWR